MKVHGKILVIVTLVASLVILSFNQIPVQASFSWSPLGGATIASPGVTGIYDQNTGNHLRIDVVVRGSDNGIYHRYFTWAGGWSPNWVSLNGFTNDQPAVVYAQYNYKDTLHVVVRGTDNRLYHKKFDIASATWDTSWEWVDPSAERWYAASAPALVHYSNSYGDGFLLFFRGTDNYIRYGYWQNNWKIYAGKTWLMGLTLDTPAVMVTNYLAWVPEDKVHLVVRGTDNGIYYINGSLLNVPYFIDWNVDVNGNPSWQKLPGSTISAPALASRLDDYTFLHLVVRGSDNVIYHNMYQPNAMYAYWNGWESLGGATNERPAIWVGGIGSLVITYIYVRGTDNVVYRRAGYFQYNSWTWEPPPPPNGWVPMNGLTSSAPAIGEGNLVVRGTDNVPYYSPY